MSIQLIYNIATTIFYLFFGIIWKASNTNNLAIKIICILFAIAGAFITLKDLGYIIKV
jgi:hypothetical protein